MWVCPGMPSLPFAVVLAGKSGLRLLLLGRGWWSAVTQKGKNQWCSFRLLLTWRLSFSHPHSINPKSTWRLIISQADRRLDSDSRKLVPSYSVCTDDIVGAEGASCRFLFPLPGEAEEELSLKVPSATSQLLFSWIRLEGTNIGLLILDIWILLTRTLKLLFAFKLNGF